MRLSLLTIIPVLLLTLTGLSQNLVPNPGFEDYSQCPANYGNLNFADHWFRPTSGSSDYFNACAPVGSHVSVPYNYAGSYQQARNGNAYAGVAVYKDNYIDYREYIETDLLQTLEKDRCYFLEMYVSLQDLSKYATDAFGAALVEGPKTYNTSTTVNLYPYIKNPLGSIMTDSTGWMQITGYYNAKGNENHLIIGNFMSDNQMSISTVKPFSNESYAYYYIDDVSLVKLENSIELGPDTTLCTGDTLILEIDLPGAQILWADGSNENLRKITENGTYKVEVTIGQCQPLSDSIKVSFVEPPLLFSTEDTMACEGQPFLLKTQADSASYIWNTGSTLSLLSVTLPGTYGVTVTNACGTYNDSIHVDFEECSSLIYVPNAFTPNGDGLNDCFKVKGTNLIYYQLTIFDRWGKMVFITNDQEACWDGRINGQLAPAGIYVYQITYAGEGRHILDMEGTRSGFLYLLD